MIFIAMVHIVFTGNSDIIPSHNNVFSCDNIRCINVYVFIGLDGHISRNTANGRTFLYHISVCILIPPFFTANGKAESTVMPLGKYLSATFL